MTEHVPTDKRTEYLRHAQVAAALVAASCVGTLVAIVALGLEDRHRQPGQTVFDFIAHLPTSGWLYVAVGSIVVLGLASYWHRLEKTKSDFALLSGGEENASLGSNREIAVVRGLRLRALALRTRAVLFLGSSIMLLLGGVYVTIWVVPIVSSYDVQEQVRALLSFKFGDTLDALREGEYWVYAKEVKADEIKDLRVSRNEKEDVDEFVVDAADHVLVSTDGLDWERRNLSRPPRQESQRRPIDVRLGEGGLETVYTRENMDRDDRGSLLVLNDDGTHGIVEKMLLGVYVRHVEERSWNYVELILGSGSNVTFVEFDSEGTHGLFGTTDGATTSGGTVYVTADGGANWETWTGQSIGLNRSEWAVGAAIGSDGPRVVVGDEGTVRIRDGDGWRAPKGVDEWPSVTVVEFDADGLHGLVGTRDGDVHVTADGGANWETWTGQGIGLSVTEWAVGAAIDGDGPRVVVGDEGTVRIRDGDGWRAPKGVDEWPSVTVVEFDADGLHGLVGTRDGDVHVTADGGANWETWTGQGIGLSVTEWAVGAAIDGDGPRVVVGDEGAVRIRDGDGWRTPKGADDWPSADGGSKWVLPENSAPIKGSPAFVGNDRFAVLRTRPAVFTTENNGASWSLSEELTKAAPLGIGGLYADDDRVALSTTSGTIWIKGDGDGDWSQLGASFGGDESIAAIVFDKDELIAIGSKGTTSTGNRLDSARGDFELEEEENVIAAAAVAGSLVALVEGKAGGSIYVRREFLEDLVNDPLALLDDLPEGGKLKGDLAAELASLNKTVDSTPRSLEDATLIERLGVDQVHWLRAVATLATIYLVQLFVGLYRYSVRLAAHWDSRADAVLLGRSSSGTNTSFKDLIAALGPDALDFKPPRHPYSPSWHRSSKPDDSS